VIRSSMSRLIPLAAAMLLLAVSAGGVAAAKQSKSFEATFCFTQSTDPTDPAPPAGTGDLTASVSWSGYRVDGIGLGVGDGSGAGYGVIDPVEPAARAGSQSVTLGVSNDVPFGGVDIRLGNHIWASIEQDAPNGNWANLSACA
jgi:hypothetical protein